MNEAIFTRQEQGVVYLFSRYWDQIDVFDGKRIQNIHTHFPDFLLHDIATEDEEAVEFEYGLNGFYTHVDNGDLQKLMDGTITVLYIIYWDEDADRDQLLRRTRKQYKGKVVLVCLSKYFSPVVERETNRLGAYWEFRSPKCFDKVYLMKEIEEATDELERRQVVYRLKLRGDLYRVAGFNKSNSDFIECDHWKRIHFYTTTRLHDDSIPSRLFVRPTGSRSFSGYFEVKRAFKTLKVKDKRLVDYYRRFYFYPHEDFDPERLERFTSLVYSDFVELDAKRGVAIYNYLKGEGYHLRQTSELVSDDKRHRQEIDKILG